jgi:hypothetical protein
MDFIKQDKLKVFIYSPRTSLRKIIESDDKILQELMLKLDPFTINVLTNDFETAGGELNCEDFIIMML